MAERRFFINELSVATQAESEHAAGEILGALAETLKTVQQQGTSAGHEVKVARSCDLSNRRLLAVGLPEGSGSVGDCLRRLRQYDVRVFLWQMVTNAPHSEELLKDWPEHFCQRVEGDEGNALTDVRGGSIAAAAALDGALVSLRGCEAFPVGVVLVRYRAQEGGEVCDVRLTNVVETSDVEANRRIYEASKKHQIMPRDAGGVVHSAMDLSPEDAQRVLDRAEALYGEKRLFARHEQRLYVFFEHRTLRFHGYRVDDPDEYQSRDVEIYNHLRRLGWVG